MLTIHSSRMRRFATGNYIKDTYNGIVVYGLNFFAKVQMTIADSIW
jgi:hypothetical protein